MLQNAIESAFPDIKVFVSANRANIPLGIDWMQRIKDALQSSRVYLILVTKRSENRPWVWLETGVAWSADRIAIPMCIGGPRKDALARPWSDFQGINLDEETDIADLFERIAEVFEEVAPKIDLAGITHDLVSVEQDVSSTQVTQENEEVARTSPPPALSLSYDRDTHAGVAITPLRVTNQGPSLISFEILGFGADSDLPGLDQDRVQNITDQLNGRFRGRALTLGSGNDAELYDSVPPEIVRVIVLRFAYIDVNGKRMTDEIRGY